MPFDAAVVQTLLADWQVEIVAAVPGFSPTRGSTVEARDFATPAGVFLLAVSGEEPVGCGGLRRLTPVIGEVKRLFVRRVARGRGVARTLLDGLEDRAGERGFGALRLDTTGGNAAVLELFRSAGYEPIADYNGNPYARHRFEKRLT